MVILVGSRIYAYIDCAEYQLIQEPISLSLKEMQLLPFVELFSTHDNSPIAIEGDFKQKLERYVRIGFKNSDDEGTIETGMNVCSYADFEGMDFLLQRYARTSLCPLDRSKLQLSNTLASPNSISTGLHIFRCFDSNCPGDDNEFEDFFKSFYITFNVVRMDSYNPIQS